MTVPPEHPRTQPKAKTKAKPQARDPLAGLAESADLGETGPDSRKRLFVALTLGTAAAMCCLLALLWLVPFIGLRNIHPAAPLVLGGVLTVAVVLVLWASLGLVLNIVLGRSVLFSKRLRGLTIKLLLPVMALLGRLAGISKERIRSSFIKVNNELVLSERYLVDADRLLLLMPHCLQNSRCDKRLTYDIDNCKRCGKCPLSGLLALRDHYGVHLAIATGGTIARRIVVQKRPKLIVAVACERDLSSGIQDTYPLPVYGVLNDRPHGPCLDTLVQLEHVEQALRMFLKVPPAVFTDAKLLQLRPARPACASAGSAGSGGSGSPDSGAGFTASDARETDERAARP